MIKEYPYKDHKWIDLENPTKEEINSIITYYKIPEDVAEDLFSPTPKQRVTVYEDCIYAVLHFPALNSKVKKIKQSGEDRQEIDFIVSKDFLITVHYDTIRSIEAFEKRLQHDETAKDDENAAFIFHKLTKHLYHSLLHDVEKIKEALHTAETSIFEGEEKRMVIELSKIHRDILRFNNALVPHREAIGTLQAAFKDLWGEKYEELILDMQNEYKRVERRINSNKELSVELRHTNDSLLSAKQNEAIKGLTMMAFITFPLTLIATLFSMRTEETPIIGTHYDFWIVLWLMLLVVICCIGFFNYKKWL